MAKAKDPSYLAYSTEDRLALANNTLRSREEEHYRLWLSTPPDQLEDNSRLDNLQDEIDRLQGEVKKLQTEAK